LHTNDGELESYQGYGRFESMEWKLREPSYIFKHVWWVSYDYSEVLPILLAPSVSYVDVIVFDDF